MRRAATYVVSGFLGAVGLAAAAVGDAGDMLVAAAVGAGLGVIVALVFHAYPDDIAPPADRRHENTQRRKTQKT